MKKEETKQLLEILKVAYPRHYANLTQQSAREILNLYYDIFKEVPTEIVVIALKNYIKVNKYHPSIAGLWEQVEMLTDTNTAEILWTAIEKAASNSGYNSKEEFDKLPDECKRFIGSAGALKELGQMDGGTLNTVTKGQFMKQIGTIKQRIRAKTEFNKLGIMQLEGDTNEHIYVDSNSNNGNSGSNI